MKTVKWMLCFEAKVFLRQCFIYILSQTVYNEKSSSLSTFIYIVVFNFLAWSAPAHADSMPTSVLS